MEVFNLDIIPGKSAPVIHASQYDVGREFKANLFEGPAVYTLSGAETLAVYVRKPDGNMVTVAVTNTSDSYITFETTEQMTACDGASLCELRIQNGADVIGTANFILECEKSPDTGITSQTEINNLETLVDGFTALAVANQYDSANVIFDATPTAGHGNGYAPTSESITFANCLDTNFTGLASGNVPVYNGTKWINSNMPKQEVTSQITFTEDVSGTNTRFYTKAGVLYIFFQGKSVAHSSGDDLFTLPSGLRPTHLVYVPFVCSDGANFMTGDVSINVNGACKVAQISNTSNAGRIYFSVAIPLI